MPNRVAAADTMTLANDLRRALRQDELRVHYQPVMRLGCPSLMGLERAGRTARDLIDAGTVLPSVAAVNLYRLAH